MPRLIGGGTGGGPPGPPGPSGSKWYDATGAPTIAAASGDQYLDTASGDCRYMTSTWQFGLNLVGPQGLQGSVWHTGAGAPTPAAPDGDYYLDTTGGEYYAHLAGGWNLTGNLTGPQGVQGIQGNDGPTGPPGVPGATWYEGPGAPAAASGVDDDFYLDTGNGDVYQKQAGAWVVVANLTGPGGAAGRWEKHGQPVESCTTLTTEANELMRPIRTAAGSGSPARSPWPGGPSTPSRTGLPRSPRSGTTGNPFPRRLGLQPCHFGVYNHDKQGALVRQRNAVKTATAP
jgi:hypothetical protein